MTIKNNLLLFFITIFLFVSPYLFSQERKNQELPKLVGVTKSINNLKGWQRNDIGKWEQAFNGIPFGSQVQRIDISKISYEEKEYLCIAQFDKTYFYKMNQKLFQYSSNFWLFDLHTTKDLQYNDTNVYTKVFKNIIVSNVLGGLQPVTWTDILSQVKRCFMNTYPNDTSQNEYFFLKYRYYYKLNKAQFYIGSIDKTFYDFTNYQMCFDDSKNEDLDCCYFEVDKNLFNKNFYFSGWWGHQPVEKSFVWNNTCRNNIQLVQLV